MLLIACWGATASSQIIPILVYHRFDPALPRSTTLRTALFGAHLRAGRLALQWSIRLQIRHPWASRTCLSSLRNRSGYAGKCQETSRHFLRSGSAHGCKTSGITRSTSGIRSSRAPEQVRAAKQFWIRWIMLWNPRNRYEGLGLDPSPATEGTQSH